MCVDFLLPPDVSAHLLAEFPAPVDPSVRALPGGRWAVREAGGRLLVLDAGLAPVAAFEAPDGDFLADVSRDLRLAAFAETHRISVTDTSGRVVWSVEHPAFVGLDGDPLGGCARFRDDRLHGALPGRGRAESACRLTRGRHVADHRRPGGRLGVAAEVGARRELNPAVHTRRPGRSLEGRERPREAGRLPGCR